MSKDHFGNVQPLLDNEEHEHNYEPATKRVMPYGWDGSAKRSLSVDASGQLNVNMVSGTITGTSYATIDVRNVVNSITTVANPVEVSNFSGSTIYAVVNTSAAGQSSVVLDTGSKWIGLATVDIGNSVNIGNFSGSTIYAVVNTGAVGNTNALATLLAGSNQIGSVTVSNEISALATVNVSNILGSIVTIAPRTDYIGLASVSGNVVVSNEITALATVNISNTLAGIVTVANFANIGVSTVNINNTINALATVNISNVINSIVTIAPRTDYIGLMSVNLGGTLPALVAGTAQIGSVTISNYSGIGLATVNLNTGAGWFGLATVVVGAGVAQMGSVTVSNTVNALATVNVSNTINSLATVIINAGISQIGSVTISNMQALVAGTAQVGSVTVSSIGPGVATIGIIRSITEEMGGKIFMTAPIAINATNLSGSTIFVSSASKRFYVTNTWLSTASIVGISVLSGATYLVGNASVRMQLSAQSGIVNSGTIDSPLFHGLADQQNFLLVTDTAAPVSGRVIWYEE